VPQAYVAEKEAAAAAKQKAIEEYESSLHPWEAQMTACDLLSKYLTPFAPKEEVEAEVAPEASKGKKDATLDLLFAGAASKSKGAKTAGKVSATVVFRSVMTHRCTQAKAGKSLTHDRVVFERFLFLGIQPPVKTTEIPELLVKLAALKVFFSMFVVGSMCFITGR
jgi:hypothetical protein